jgi:hypothetical protein
MITFILGGIWHGAGWTFIFWGFLHGLALVVHRLWKSFGMNMPRVLAWFITFNFINIAWVFFRAKEWGDAVKVLSGMFGYNSVMNHYAYEMYLLENRLSTKNLFTTIQGDNFTLKLLIGAFILVLLFKPSQEYIRSFKFSFINFIFFSFITTIGILHLTKMSEFLYFNF